MGYIVQKTRAAALTIGGQDYTSSLISWTASDKSANREGFIVTTGELRLGQRPGEANVEDYDRNLFKRGTLVTLDVTEPGGAAYRHPRGYLYVIAVSYDVESEELVVDLGCRLALSYLNDDASSVYPLVPIPLDEAQRTIQNCSASFAANGEYLYQDNQGDLVSGTFFDGDNNSATAAGEWVSVLGETAISVQPLAGGQAIPDKITLSYQVPAGVISTDETGKIDIVTEISQYFTQYPAATYDRVEIPGSGGSSGGEDASGNSTGIADIVDAGGTTSPPITVGGTSGCGNTPSVPRTTNTTIITEEGDPYNNSISFSCNAGYQTVAAPTFVGATRTSISTTEYSGPGAQVSRVVQEVYGPAVEVNNQYYADKFAYCVQTYGYACNPNANCPMEGLETVLQSRSITRNYYGAANELVRTVADEYVPTLAAAQPFNWRSGTSGNGQLQDFNGSLDATQLFRVRSTVTDYYQEGNANVQFTTTHESMSSRGGGIYAGPLDALKGIRTTVKRISTTITTLDIKPDTANSVTTSTTERTTEIPMGTSSYITPPSEAGPYILEEAVPVPLLFEDDALIEAAVDAYSEYLKRFVKGDLYGLEIAEALRSDIVTNWRPGMPFRYVDTVNDRIMAMRMDACQWGVTQDESLVVTSGVWTGYSTGSLVTGDNLVGNSRPDMSGDTPTPPTAPAPPPSISDDEVAQSFYFVVNVDLQLKADVFVYGENGVNPIVPEDLSSKVEFGFAVFTNGVVVQAGDTVATTGSGGVPLDYAGSLLVADATVVVPDLFA